jgi:hypothetical protein
VTTETGTFSDGRNYTIVRWDHAGCGVAYYRKGTTERTISIDTWNHDATGADLTKRQALSLVIFLLWFVMRR